VTGDLAAAEHLADELGPRVVGDVEAALPHEGAAPAPERYFVDPIWLGSLIVSVATLAWTIDSDQRKRTAAPSRDHLERRIRVELRSTDSTAPEQRDRVISAVVSEVIEHADRAE
jgi:hypothetical protein